MVLRSLRATTLPYLFFAEQAPPAPIRARNLPREDPRRLVGENEGVVESRAREKEDATMTRDKISAGVRAALAAAALAVTAGLATAGPALAQESRFGFGTDLGVWTGTVADDRFALGFNLDYYLGRAFSVGPMVLLAPTGDLTEIAFAPVARFHIRLTNLNIVPFAGVGFVHADLERGQGPGRVDTNDTSYYIPLGLTAEVPVSEHIALAGTLLVNLHNLELDPPVGDDDTSVALMFGLRFGP